LGKYTSEIRITKRSRIQYSSLIGKLKEYKRSRITLTEKKGELQITIDADDITALRATFNGITKDIAVIEEASKI
jgi:tRNA threonylcarbamoyladenosine modification (KEOPS) complex  Pcc1 subunit